MSPGSNAPPEFSEDLFRLIFEAAPNALLMVARDGTIVLANKRAEELFEYSRDEMQGSRIEMLVPPAQRAGHPTLRDSYFARPSARRMAMGGDQVLHGLTRSGQEVPVEIGLNPIQNGSDTFVLASVIDISERLQAEDKVRSSEVRFRQVVEAAPNAMIMVDQRGYIILVNRQAESLFGYDRQEMLDQHLEMLVPPSARKNHPALRQHYIDRPETRAMGRGRDLFGLHKSGREIPIEIGLNPIRTERGQCVLASIIDITERKRAEQAQLELNRSLELQVEETQRALEQLHLTQDNLIQAEKLASLGGLVAGVSHEVNTPIGIGVTAASHLQSEISRLRRAARDRTLTQSQLDLQLDDFEQSADIILRNLQRAADLISSFKQVAVDQSTDEMREVALHDYIDEVLLSLKPKLKGTRHRVTFECPEDIYLRTVPGALAQILTNLFVNALTHAFDDSQAGTIVISVQREDDRLVLKFSDDGRGIPPGQLDLIFDPFFTTRRAQGGTGLGLNIVFNLVHKTLGGNIKASSELGRGTTFTITLPTSSAEES